MILRRHQWWLALLMLAIPGMAGAIKFDSPYYYSMSHFEMPEDMNQFTSVQMLVIISSTRITPSFGARQSGESDNSRMSPQSRS